MSELRITCSAEPNVAKRIRHAVAAFLDVLNVAPETSDDVLTAVGEALANAIEHAYEGADAPGLVKLNAALEAANLRIEVCDQGQYIERDLRSGRGFGLRIIHSIASSVDITTDHGTQIKMSFEIG